jgi:protein-S-isoprenylcysteine O-methyltransferase Ste14
MGKFLYALIFTIGIPLLIWYWGSSVQINRDVPFDESIGICFMVIGMLFISIAMLQLFIQGKGLPMNAYPPKFLVNNGLYAWFKHPIYVGFVLLVFGFFIWQSIPFGFWYVSPIIALCCLALVYGFENAHIQKIYQPTNYHTNFYKALFDSDKVTVSNRILIALMAFVPWLIVYEGAIYFGPSNQPINTYLTPKSVKVFPAFIILYSLVYPFVAMVPVLVSNRMLLRKFVFMSWIGTIIGGLILWAFPFVAVADVTTPDGFFADWIRFEKQVDAVWACLPSFHVFWVFTAYYIYGLKYKGARNFLLVYAWLATIACWFTAMHAVFDLAVGYLLYLVARNYDYLWKRLSVLVEKLANSWNATQVGSFRIMHHAVFPFLAASTGYLILFSILHDHGLIIITGCATLAGGAIWGRWIEGSTALQRPFGYFGAILGGAVALVIMASYKQISVFDLMAAISIAAPAIVAIGRLRCVSQGCCHGCEAHNNNGLLIRVTHPQSRVVKISGMHGVIIHATPFYSLMMQILILAFTSRMYYEGCSSSLITGTYFILSGIGRFIEENYRGESQTKYWNGLRIYQWFAIVFVLIGIGFTMMNSSSLPQTNMNLQIKDVIFACMFGLITAFAMGVDFPQSKKPFSRLA